MGQIRVAKPDFEFIHLTNEETRLGSYFATLAFGLTNRLQLLEDFGTFSIWSEADFFRNERSMTLQNLNEVCKKSNYNFRTNIS